MIRPASASRSLGQIMGSFAILALVASSFHLAFLFTRLVRPR